MESLQESVIQESIFESGVLDETVESEEVAKVEYDITSYGADYDVEGLVRRLDRSNIVVPDFQRDYVWTIAEASRFVESLLLGLPVPGIFLAREPETERLLVIDGQQRLKTLQFFYKGVFNTEGEDNTRRVFQLNKVQPYFEGKTFEDMEVRDQERLNNSILHATIVKQERPSNDNTSIYHIFERLNTGGRKLTPQQIRAVVYHGPLIDLLKHLNENVAWRAIFGRKNKLLKDQELILRFLALFFDSSDYKSPMKEFLNVFAGNNRSANSDTLVEFENLFSKTITKVYEAFGKRAFRLEKVLNAAVFDSVMVGVARRITSEPHVDTESLKQVYESLLQKSDYLQAVTQGTANERSVENRLNIATDVFAGA